MYVLSPVRLFVTPWTVAHQSPLSMEFSRQEYWSGWPFPSPWDLPHPGIKPRLPALQVILNHLSHPVQLHLRSSDIRSQRRGAFAVTESHAFVYVCINPLYKMPTKWPFRHWRLPLSGNLLLIESFPSVLKESLLPSDWDLFLLLHLLVTERTPTFSCTLCT